MTLTAVTISQSRESFLHGINYYCHTDGYKPILHRNNTDPERINYITTRYDNAVNEALRKFPETDEVMIVDSYYLHQPATENFLRRHIGSEKIIGCSIWCVLKHNAWNNIRYYDTLSVKELKNRAWHGLGNLPKGIIPVSSVGGCWMFPRQLWKGKFRRDWTGESLVNSASLDEKEALLDCNLRLWRTSADNPDITTFPLTKRVRVSLGGLRRRF